MARRKPARIRADVQQPDYTPTIIEFLLDETGSMSSYKSATVGGFNDFLNEQKAQPGTCLLTLTKFASGRVSTPYVDLDVRMVPGMFADWFLPNGGTNLYDAIGARIQAVKERTKDWTVKPNVLFVVMTDGDDTCSRNLSEQTVKSGIKMCSDEGWTCVYLGADQNAVEKAGPLGFSSGNIKSFAGSEMRETMQNLAAATTVYRAARSSGMHTSGDFFKNI